MTEVSSLDRIISLIRGTVRVPTAWVFRIDGDQDNPAVPASSQGSLLNCHCLVEQVIAQGTSVIVDDVSLLAPQMMHCTSKEPPSEPSPACPCWRATAK